jgi:hypothetical protein
MGAYAALVRKDLRIFFGDRRAVILTLAVPIAIAVQAVAIYPVAVKPVAVLSHVFPREPRRPHRV